MTKKTFKPDLTPGEDEGMVTCCSYEAPEFKDYYDWQKMVLANPYPKKLIVGGRRVGKSRLAAAVIIKALEADKNVITVHPMQDMASTFYHNLAVVLGDRTFTRRKRPNIIEMGKGRATGIVVSDRVKSDRAKGAHADLVVVEEAAYLDDMAYETIGMLVSCCPDVELLVVTSGALKPPKNLIRMLRDPHIHTYCVPACKSPLWTKDIEDRMREIMTPVQYGCEFECWLGNGPFDGWAHDPEKEDMKLELEELRNKIKVLEHERELTRKEE